MKWFKGVAWFLIILVCTGLLSACASSTPNVSDEGISPEMTGFDDFFMSAFDGDTYMIVYGSQGSEQDTIRLKYFAERMQSTFENHMRVEMPVKLDEEVIEEDIQNNHLILIGNPQTNSLFARVNDQLPIQVIGENLQIQSAGATIGEETAIFTYLVPNPINQTKYLWVWGASHATSFEKLQTMTMNLKTEEYMIKVDERTRYSGKFSKTSVSWTIPSLVERKSINEFETASSEHFHIRYDKVDTSTKENLAAITEKREVFYHELADQLGFEPDNAIDIDIYMTEGIMDHYVNRDNDSLYGVVYEVHEQGEEDPAYKEKMAKVFLGTLGLPLDQMLEMGLAYELASSQRYLLSSVHPEAAVFDLIDSGDLIPLQYLTGARINPELDHIAVKEELRSFLHYLIGEYGMNQVLALYQANESMGVEDAVYEVFEKDLLDLEAEWLELLNH